MLPRSFAVAFALLLNGAACRPSGRADGNATAPSGEPASIASSDAPSASGSSESEPKAAPTASSASETSPLGGSWSGSYEAKRAIVKLSKATPWPAWKRDAGKQVGKGTLDLEVSDQGDVRGKASGALGPLVISGRVEDGMLRASALPEDPLAEGTMTGIVTGELKGATLHALLRVSNRRGEAVRTAEATLKRK